MSAALDHNVDSLLVGIVKQIHLKLFSHLQNKRSKGRLYTRYDFFKIEFVENRLTFLFNLPSQELRRGFWVW